MLVTVVWDAVAAAVTGRCSWLPGLAAVLLGIGLMVLIGKRGRGPGNAVAAPRLGFRPGRRPNPSEGRTA